MSAPLTYLSPCTSSGQYLCLCTSKASKLSIGEGIDVCCVDVLVALQMRHFPTFSGKYFCTSQASTFVLVKQVKQGTTFQPEIFHGPRLNSDPSVPGQQGRRGMWAVIRQKLMYVSSYYWIRFQCSDTWIATVDTLS